MRLWRAESLNDSQLLTAALADVARLRLSKREKSAPIPARANVNQLHVNETHRYHWRRDLGLSAAFFLEQRRLAGVPLEYALFETSPRFGGVIFSERVDDCLVEAGPDSFLTEKPWVSELCHELGIADQLVGSNDSQRKTYILVNENSSQCPTGSPS